MVLFIVLTFIGKTMRTALGINFVMFDPLVFFAILIIKYMDIMSFFIFLFLTVFLADANAGNLTAGSLLNYVLFKLIGMLGGCYYGINIKLILEVLFTISVTN